MSHLLTSTPNVEACAHSVIHKTATTNRATSIVAINVRPMSDVLSPVLGDPFEVSVAGSTLNSIAADVATQAARLRALAETDSAWAGAAADRARARTATLPRKLDDVTTSYATAGSALGSYSRALAAAQTQSQNAIATATRAADDLAAARAGQAVASAADAVAARVAEAAGQPRPPTTAHRYNAVIEEAQRRLAIARSTNDDAHHDQQHAAISAVRALHAAHHAIPKQSWWHHLTSSVTHWASTYWADALRQVARLANTVSAIAGIAALALAIGGIFFPPLELAAASLETISLATAIVATVSDATLAATGHESWTAAGLDAVSLAPAGLGKIAGKVTPLLRETSTVRGVGRFIGSRLPSAPIADFGDGAGGKAFALGFRDSGKFRDFGTALRNGLDDAGYLDTVPIMQGSSVTGVKYLTGEPFDVGRRSDYDVALAGDDLLAAAKQIGVELRSRGTRTAELTPENVEELGLTAMNAGLEATAKREVKFMIFRSAEETIGRSKSIRIGNP